MKLNSFTMYDYLSTLNSFSTNFDLNKELFNINCTDEKLIYEFYDCQEFEIHPLNHKYFYGFQLKQNIEENWQCFTFHIKTSCNIEILKLLNQEFSKIDSNIIDLDEAKDLLRYELEYEFHHYENDHLLINGLISEEESYVSISKRVSESENIYASSQENQEELIA